MRPITGDRKWAATSMRFRMRDIVLYADGRWFDMDGTIKYLMRGGGGGAVMSNFNVSSKRDRIIRAGIEISIREERLLIPGGHPPGQSWLMRG